MQEFLGIFIYFAIATALASVLAGVSYIFSTQRPDAEKFPHTSVDLIHLMIHVVNLMFNFILWPFYLLFLTLKLHFYFHGQLYLEKLVVLVLHP